MTNYANLKSITIWFKVKRQHCLNFKLFILELVPKWIKNKYSTHQKCFSIQMHYVMHSSTTTAQSPASNLILGTPYSQKQAEKHFFLGHMYLLNLILCHLIFARVRELARKHVKQTCTCKPIHATAEHRCIPNHINCLSQSGNYLHSFRQ